MSGGRYLFHSLHACRARDNLLFATANAGELKISPLSSSGSFKISLSKICLYRQSFQRKKKKCQNAKHGNDGVINLPDL